MKALKLVVGILLLLLVIAALPSGIQVVTAIVREHSSVGNMLLRLSLQLALIGLPSLAAVYLFRSALARKLD